MIHLMARKHYSSEFHRQAVDLFESTAGATFQGIAADLGITRGTLAHWVRALGTGTTTSPPGATTPGSTSAPPGRVESPAARLVRLEARVGRPMYPGPMGTNVTGLAPLSQMRGVQPLTAQHLTTGARLGVLILLDDLELVSRRERSALGPLRDLATGMICHNTSMGAAI